MKGFGGSRGVEDVDLEEAETGLLTALTLAFPFGGIVLSFEGW